MTPRATTLRACLLALAGCAVLALTTPMGTDYPADAGPALAALADGDLRAYAADQPMMGPLTLLARAPVVAVAGDGLWGYRLGALLLLAVALCGLAALLARRAPSAGIAAAAAAILAVNPVTIRALELGHPEEPLGAALCVGAVLLALDGRTRLAAVALGLALATKQWALLAVVPVLACLPDRRARAEGLVLAGGLAALLYLPALLADPRAFLDALDRPAGGLSAMRPVNLPNLFAGEARTVDGVAIMLVPGWLRSVAHPAVAALGIGLPLLLAFRRRRRWDARLALSVLAAVFLARCALDPWNHEYYHWPLLATLAALEVVVARRAPLVTAASSAVLWLLFAQFATPGERGLVDVGYLLWCATLTAWLLRRAPSPSPSRAAVAV